MRCLNLLSLILIAACNNNQHERNILKSDTIKPLAETLQVAKVSKPEASSLNSYSNKRFKDVTVEKISRDSFLIRGKGQIFEANFSWVVEDGHEELKQGFQMTDAGAREWGSFQFAIRIPKKRVNSTLTLILFESSAKDGSRQYELPLILY